MFGVLFLIGLYWITGLVLGHETGQKASFCEYYMYEVKPMGRLYEVLDDDNNVLYYKKDKFDKQIFFRDGKIFDATGAPFSSYNFAFINFRAIWVMDGYGNFFATTEQLKEYVHHSSLMDGRPVAAAGEMVVWRGRLKYINDLSGHYHPRAHHFFQALTQLSIDLGVEAMGSVRIERFSVESDKP